MSIAAVVKQILQNNNIVADTLITYGQRNQEDTLPAITYLITSNETLAIGNMCVLKKCIVEISSISNAAQDAMENALAIEDHIANTAVGQWGDYKVSGFSNLNSVLENPTSGFGEESNPFVAVTTVEFLYAYHPTP